MVGWVRHRILLGCMRDMYCTDWFTVAGCDGRLKEENCRAKKAARTKEAAMQCELNSEKRKSDNLSAEVKRLREKVVQVRAVYCFLLFVTPPSLK